MKKSYHENQPFIPRPLAIKKAVPINYFPDNRPIQRSYSPINMSSSYHQNYRSNLTNSYNNSCYYNNHNNDNNSSNDNNEHTKLLSRSVGDEPFSLNYMTDFQSSLFPNNLTSNNQTEIPSSSSSTTGNGSMEPIINNTTILNSHENSPYITPVVTYTTLKSPPTVVTMRDDNSNITYQSLQPDFLKTPDLTYNSNNNNSNYPMYSDLNYTTTNNSYNDSNNMSNTSNNNNNNNISLIESYNDIEIVTLNDLYQFVSNSDNWSIYIYQVVPNLMTNVSNDVTI